MIWGAAPLPASMPAGLKGPVILGEFMFSRYRLLLLAVVAVVLAGIWFLIHRTSFGRVVRAGISGPTWLPRLEFDCSPT